MQRTVQIKTPVPGPRSRELLARREQAVPRGVANVTPIFAQATAGAALQDVDGNVLLDFAGGIGVLGIGANHPAVVAAVRQQVERYLHTCFHVTMYEPYVQLAEALNRLTPGGHSKKTLLTSTGVEAVENAVKLARRYTNRPAVVTFTGAFHGRTLLGMTLTAKVATYKHGFGPFAPEVYRLPACYAYRSPYADPAVEVRARLAEVRRAIEEEIGADQVAALIIEPVQGEGGFIVQPPEFLQGLRALCDDYGAVLIADEVQTGFGRTGRFFAVEHAGVAPDLITMAKALGGGLPIGAVTGRAEIMDAAQVGGLGGTYGGNPVACAAALAVIEVMQQQRLCERAAALGKTIRARLKSWEVGCPLVGEARGLGAMAAVELVEDRGTRRPAGRAAEAIVQRCYANGLILMKAGTAGHVLRLLIPLTISDAELHEGLGIMEQAIAAQSPRAAG